MDAKTFNEMRYLAGKGLEEIIDEMYKNKVSKIVKEYEKTKGNIKDNIKESLIGKYLWIYEQRVNGRKYPINNPFITDIEDLESALSYIQKDNIRMSLGLVKDDKDHIPKRLEIDSVKENIYFCKPNKDNITKIIFLGVLN